MYRLSIQSIGYWPYENAKTYSFAKSVAKVIVTIPPLTYSKFSDDVITFYYEKRFECCANINTPIRPYKCCDSYPCRVFVFVAVR